MYKQGKHCILSFYFIYINMRNTNSLLSLAKWAQFVRKMGLCSKKRGRSWSIVRIYIRSLHEIIFQPNLAQLKFMMYMYPCEIFIISPTPLHEILEDLVDQLAQKRLKKGLIFWHFEFIFARLTAIYVKSQQLAFI